MKTKTNKIIVLLAALLMIVCLAACSGKDSGIGFYYDGKDKNDRPNLADAMTDWNAEFGYEGWHYSGQLEMKVK